jgi:hypothetical protein
MPRVYIIGVTDELGGPDGAQWIADRVQEVINYRRVNRACEVFGDVLTTVINKY